MNVIIRLQNLPWSANALDIRQFFKGLSIPDGGVHIVGGEMGDAFIAFSTDEDARQAMMHDREAINGVQVRLLLSSRAEMQKVIETARQQSLRALQSSAASLSSPKMTPPAPAVVPTMAPVAKPQPPVITTNSLQNILSNPLTAMTPSFLAYQQQAGITLITNNHITKKSNDGDDILPNKHRHRVSRSRERTSRSRSHSRDRSFNRRRQDRSRERSRDRESYVRRRSHHSRDRSRDHDRSRSRSRERSHERGRELGHQRSRNSQQTKRENKSHSHDITDNIKSKSQQNYEWSTASNDGCDTQNENLSNMRDTGSESRVLDDSKNDDEGYNTKNKSLAALNNYSLNNFLNNSNGNRGFTLQNPYTAALRTGPALASPNSTTTTSSSAIPGIFVEKKSDDIMTSLQISPNITETTLPQEPIVFADTNPYEKMYPNLFAQAAAIGTAVQKIGPNRNIESSPGSPKDENVKGKDTDPHKTRCIKIMNMCPGTTYSDIRKFCVGLYIPHNGIKMVNDIHGLRVGIAYVQFSKHACVARALSRNNQILRNRTITIEAVSEEEFESITDSFHPDNRDRLYSGSRGDFHSETSDSRNVCTNPFKPQSTIEPFSVLYIEDIPALTTEQDIMKMFSSYTLYDILLLASPENRREFVAHVRFSREEEAISAFEDKAHLQIGYRRLRVRPGSVEEMERAKEKIRQANEQLMKEEQAAAEEEDRNRKKEEEEINKKREIISLDLTQSDGEEVAEGDGDCIEDAECDDFIGNTNKLIDKVVNNDSSTSYYDRYDSHNELQNQAGMDSRSYNSGIPSLFDFDPMSSKSTMRTNDPRLRKAQRGAMYGTDSNFERNGSKSMSNFNNFNPNFNDHQSSPPTMNNIEKNFVILKNCDYSTRIGDVAQLLITANLALKHIEPLLNERQLPTGEFIVEFRKTQDAETAVNRFHNIQFMNRSLRVFPITPQEIADRLGKPFLSYIPGGKGIKVSDLKTLAAAMNVGNNMNSLVNNMEWNGNNNNMTTRGGRGSVSRFDTRDVSHSNNSMYNMNDNNEDCTLPERFSRPGCVLELENVPYKAQLSDILNFFHGFDLKSEDIIRRFNDNGQPTGDARVAFDTPEDARRAFDARKRKQIFNRTIYLNIL